MEYPIRVTKQQAILLDALISLSPVYEPINAGAFYHLPSVMAMPHEAVAENVRELERMGFVCDLEIEVDTVFAVKLTQRGRDYKEYERMLDQFKRKERWAAYWIGVASGLTASAAFAFITYLLSLWQLQ